MYQFAPGSCSPRKVSLRFHVFQNNHDKHLNNLTDLFLPPLIKKMSFVYSLIMQTNVQAFKNLLFILSSVQLSM